MNRRLFLKSSAVLAALSPLGVRAAGQPTRAHRKAFMLSTLQSPTADRLGVIEKFKLIREAAFAGVEVTSAMNQKDVLAAQDATGLAIPSVVIATHGSHPLTAPNPTTRETGLNGLKQGLRDAKAYGASSVLLVPGFVRKDVPYATAYTRSLAEIAKAVPLAEELGVAIAIENIQANQFLLSPLEAAAFVDAFKSKAVRWHLDIGNVVPVGWPEHWVQILGPRIAQIHIKEYSRKVRDERGPKAGSQVDLLTGDNDWPTVMRALDAVGYAGWLIAEQFRIPDLSDAAWLSHVSGKMDTIIAS